MVDVNYKIGSFGKEATLPKLSQRLPEWNRTPDIVAGLPKIELFLCTPWRNVAGGGVAPRMLNLGTRWWWAVSFTIRSLTVGAVTRCNHWIGELMDPRAGFGTLEARIILRLPRIEPKCHGVSTSSLIGISTELSLLPFFFPGAGIS
jgi:hypothetical protein